MANLAPELWPVLKYDVIADDIARRLRETHDPTLIKGPPGVGKSSLAEWIGSVWESGPGSTVVAKGDASKSHTSMHPFELAVKGSSGHRAVWPAISSIAKAGETLAGTAGVITATVEGLAQARPSRRRRRAVLLRDAELDVLSALEKLSRKRPLLVIADDLQCWDPDSLDLLRHLREPAMWEAFPFLEDMRVLGVQTPEPYQSVANPAAYAAFLSYATAFELGHVDPSAFEEVLVALGAGTRPSKEVTEAVYRWSGGHLAAASRCADCIAKGEGDVFLSTSDDLDFLRTVLTVRLHSLGDLSERLLEFLQVAAVVGLTFTRDELKCAAGGEEATVARLLRQCRDEHLVELDEDRGWFVHELFRRYFLQAGALDTTAIHERVADCLRLLRPGNYEVRCENAVNAERLGDAAALAVQAALQRQREGRPWRDLPAPVLQAMEAGGLTSTADVFEVALEHLNHYRFDECLDTLSELSRELPSRLRPEKEYLEAMCLMSRRSRADMKTGMSILAPWRGHERLEPELGIRLVQGLLYALTFQQDKGPAQDLAEEISAGLNARMDFDPAAKDAFHVLNRCAGSLYEPETSVKKNRDAVEHFAPDEGGSVVRRPVEYYRCLVNYGAGLISTARYERARTVYGDVEELVGAFEPGIFPRLDFFHMNRLLAEHRLGIVDSHEAVRQQRDIALEHRIEADPFYVENALAVYLALAGHHDEALEIFDRLHATLTASRTEPETSMVYLIRANRCATRFVAGHVDDAREEWRNLSDLVRQIAYVIGKYLVRRHELLMEVIQAGKRMSAHEFDEYLVVHGPIEFGPLWDNFGRGFRMPEVEFWKVN